MTTASLTGYGRLVRFGVTLPNTGVGADPRAVVDLAVAAEEAGWDGAFVWDFPLGTDEYGPDVQVAHDAWVILSQIAARTSKLTIGTMITPLPWRQPGYVAKSSATLQAASDGRFVLAVGLGSPLKKMPFAEDVDRKRRAKRLDDGLEILDGLWSGNHFTFRSEYYVVNDLQILPKVEPRVPVWVVGAWNRNRDAWPQMRSLRRALKWDGLLPHIFDGGDMVSGDLDPADIRAMCDWIAKERAAPFDVVIEAGSMGDENSSPEMIAPVRDAGATWWLEPVWAAMYRTPGDTTVMRKRIEAGPPKL